jgi:hypothetical protein
MAMTTPLVGNDIPDGLQFSAPKDSESRKAFEHGGGDQANFHNQALNSSFG